MKTDSEIQEYLRDNGYPEHVAREGRAGLIRRWSEFVAEVERGYKLGLEDYRNDLDIRGILRMAGAEGDDVAKVDARLQALLVPSQGRIWESAPGDPFWDFGYPRNAGPELLDALREAGLI